MREHFIDQFPKFKSMDVLENKLDDYEAAIINVKRVNRNSYVLKIESPKRVNLKIEKLSFILNTIKTYITGKLRI